MTMSDRHNSLNRVGFAEDDSEQVWHLIQSLSDKEKQSLLRECQMRHAGGSCKGIKPSNILLQNAHRSPVPVPPLLLASPKPVTSNNSNSIAQGTKPMQERNSVVVVNNFAPKMPNFTGSTSSRGDDYKKWRRAAKLILDDTEISNNRKKVLILQSLTDDAGEAIQLSLNDDLHTILKFLDDVYGCTDDASDLLADFYQLYQLPSQTCAQYMMLLYVKLCDIVTLGGLLKTELCRTLLRQFIRGTRDDTLLLKLRIEDLIDDPPDFSGVLFKVRQEEASRAARNLRLKQASNTHATLEEPQQVDTVGAVVQAPDDFCSSPSFCYRCGDDSHLAYDCDNMPNQEVVSRMVTECRQQALGDSKSAVAGRSATTHSPPLDLVGDTPEVQLDVNNIHTVGLIDTGSQISSVSTAFYHQLF